MAGATVLRAGKAKGEPPLKPPFFYQGRLPSVKSSQKRAAFANCYEPALFPTGMKDAVHEEV
jgi:hypothetical protein